MPNDELIAYFIINKDLGMSAGKLATQVAHVATLIACIQPNLGDRNKVAAFSNWYGKDQKKVILEAHEKDLLKLVDKGFYYIRDNGLTEIPANSLTCVGLVVMTREEAAPFIKRLQLCK